MMRAPAVPDAPAHPAHEEDHHTSFLAYRGGFYLIAAAIAMAAASFIYAVDRSPVGRYGGSWAGYVLGIAGALIILWLMCFGYRKRAYTSNLGKLEAWLSAHVYVGTALIVIVTLHTGFQFGWNIHTLAYALMLLVIASGWFGVFCYCHYPALMTRNRAGTTMTQMLARIAELGNELRASAMGIDDVTARLVTRAIEHTAIGGSGWRQLSGRYPDCATAAALAAVDRIAARVDPEEQAAYRRLRVLLDEKAQLLSRTRRDIRYKAMMDCWLFVHVPLSFALVAALIAHIVSIFFYW